MHDVVSGMTIPVKPLGDNSHYNQNAGYPTIPKFSEEGRESPSETHRSI